MNNYVRLYDPHTYKYLRYYDANFNRLPQPAEVTAHSDFRMVRRCEVPAGSEFIGNRFGYFLPPLNHKRQPSCFPTNYTRFLPKPTIRAGRHKPNGADGPIAHHARTKVHAHRVTRRKMRLMLKNCWESDTFNPNFTLGYTSWELF